MQPPRPRRRRPARALLALAAAAAAASSAARAAFVAGAPRAGPRPGGRGPPARRAGGRAAAGRAAAPAAGGAEASAFQRLFRADRRPVVLYDGVCNMCNRAVDVALEKDPAGERLRFAALQSEVGRGLLVHCGRAATDLSSMLVVKPDGTCLVQSDAALFVGQQLEGAPLLSGASQALSALLPKEVRNVAYDVIADNRYSVLGKRSEMRVREDGRDDRFISDLPAASGA